MKFINEDEPKSNYPKNAKYRFLNGTKLTVRGERMTIKVTRNPDGTIIQLSNGELD